MNAVAAFENAFAARVGHRHGFAFWKGRVAMYAILKAMGVGDGDEVILPGYTCVMDVNPIMLLGAKPVFADIEPATYNVSPQELEKKITARTKVIVAQHTYGYPCRMDAVMDVAARHGVAVIEDCCLAMGSTYKGKLCGTFGKAAYWSFQWNKPFTTGIGGMACTSDETLAEAIRALCRESLRKPPLKPAMMLAAQRMVYRAFIYPRTTAMAAHLFRWLTRKGIVVGSSSTAEFVPQYSPEFFRGMGAGQARAGLRQLKKLDGNLAHRRHMRQVYDRLLGEAGFDVPQLPPEIDPVLVRYPLRVKNKEAAVAAATRAGVELGTWFECPLHPIETPMHLYGYQAGLCPVAEQACLEVVNLPVHPRANEKTARRTVKFLASTLVQFRQGDGKGPDKP